jgi:bla regulator protein blaR1
VVCRVGEFLIPFSLLVALGGQFERRTAPAITRSRIPFTIEQVAQPFTPPAPRALPVPAPAAPRRIPAILFGVWIAGFLVNIIRWFRNWRRLRAIAHAASPLPLNLPIPARSTRERLEPGVFGVRRPVLLLPDGIADRLTPAQFPPSARC